MKRYDRGVRPQRVAFAAVAAGMLAALPGSALSQQTAKPASSKFKSLDVNQDGFLSRTELRRFPEYTNAFGEADENRDSRLDADEFIKAESIRQRQLAAKYVDDSVITAKVKAALFRQQSLKALDVGVETHRGQVLLSGFVENDEQVKTALEVASAVDGVIAVRNGMTLK